MSKKKKQKIRKMPLKNTIYYLNKFHNIKNLNKHLKKCISIKKKK